MKCPNCKEELTEKKGMHKVTIQLDDKSGLEVVKDKDKCISKEGIVYNARRLWYLVIALAMTMALGVAMGMAVAMALAK